MTFWDFPAEESPAKSAKNRITTQRVVYSAAVLQNDRRGRSFYCASKSLKEKGQHFDRLNGALVKMRALTVYKPNERQADQYRRSRCPLLPDPTSPYTTLASGRVTLTSRTNVSRKRKRTAFLRSRKAAKRIFVNGEWQALKAQLTLPRAAVRRFALSSPRVGVESEAGEMGVLRAYPRFARSSALQKR